jgi:uncharacterized membrane protein
MHQLLLLLPPMYSRDAEPLLLLLLLLLLQQQCQSARTALLQLQMLALLWRVTAGASTESSASYYASNVQAVLVLHVYVLHYQQLLAPSQRS